MRDKYYFFSDVHLGLESFEKEKEKEKLLVNFLNEIKNDAKEIFIVGDLFDCWIEYKEVVPKGYYRLFSKISELIDEGVKFNYLAGNHDFWKGKFFKEEFGIEICFSHIERTIEGKKIFIHHGDGYVNKDYGYRILRRILRNNLSQFLYSWIHPDLGIKLAKRTSRTSRIHTSQKDYSVKDGLRDSAFKKIEEGFNYVIMGHRHKPQMTQHGNGFYINLGDWIKNNSYGVYKNGEFELKFFLKKEISEKK
jgi:UDP-2,3-diacylglucosamine hydrolase